MRFAAVGVATLVAGLSATPGALAAGGCSSHTSWGTTVPSFERQVVALVNQHRRSMGLRPLRRSPPLTGPRYPPGNAEDPGRESRRRARWRRDDAHHLGAHPRAADPAVPRGRARALRPLDREPGRDR